MVEQQTYLSVLYLLIAAVIAVPLFKRIGLGSILGYLFAGILIGPNVLHLIDQPQDLLHFAEIGVVMLLFIIGLELNPESLWQMRRSILGLGLGQLLSTALVFGLLLLWWLDLSLGMTAVVSLAVALSSTAFVVQLMSEKRIFGTPLGRQGFSILLLQDMAVIPILLLLQGQAAVETDHAGISWWMSVVIVLMVLVAGRYLLNPFLNRVATYGNNEVMTSAALLIVLGTAYLFEHAGLSMGMGAFVAGILLANSSYRHQLETDIEPFKGVLLGLFFLAIGMNLQLELFLNQPLLVLITALIIVAVKAAIIFGLFRAASVQPRDGMRMAIMLSQGGEFSFVVMTQALSLSLIDPTIANWITISVGLSMAITSPLLSLYERTIYYRREKREYDQINYEKKPEVIIAGFDRFGQIAGRILTANGIPYTAMDKNADQIEFVKRFGNKVFYGDATRMDLLKAAGIEHARVLLVALNASDDAVHLVERVKALYPHVKIIARAGHRRNALKLMSLGAEHVLRETYASSLEASEATLIELGYKETQAKHLVEMFREHDEKMLEETVQHHDNVEELVRIGVKKAQELEQLFKDDRDL